MFKRLMSFLNKLFQLLNVFKTFWKLIYFALLVIKINNC